MSDYDPAAYKQFERAAFNAVASTYELWEETARPFREALIERAGIAVGQTTLDVACASGGLVLTAASIVGPEGKAVGVDISDGMVATARRRAARRGVLNTEFKQMDAEHLEFGDACFDAVTAGLAMLHFPNPRQAAAEMLRVLKPGGRVALSTWDAGSYHALISHYGAEISRQAPPPGPTNSAFVGQGKFPAWLSHQGFNDVGQESVEATFEFRDVNDYMEQMMGFPGRSMAHFRSLPMEVQEEALIRTFDRLEKDFQVDGGYRVPLRNIVAWGRKP
ncbi:MAG: methyltransferase domain-containing protein [Dehalococcoidia bacterium]